MRRKQIDDLREDDVLVFLAQHGDNCAFAQLLNRYYDAALQLAFSILHDWQDAEDEVQNASWKAYNNIEQLKRDSAFSTWFTRIVVNQCLMRLRQHRRQKLIHIDPSTSDSSVEFAARTQSPEAELAYSEVSNVLRFEITRIPPLLRNVFVLREIQEKSMSDVAAELGISVAAAKSRLLRARWELRHRLAKHHARTRSTTLLG